MDLELSVFLVRTTKNIYKKFQVEILFNFDTGDFELLVTRLTRQISNSRSIVFSVYFDHRTCSKHGEAFYSTFVQICGAA